MVSSEESSVVSGEEWSVVSRQCELLVSGHGLAGAFEEFRDYI